MVTSSVIPKPAFTDQDVALRAYEIWQREVESGLEPHGRDETHWYQAIEQLALNSYLRAIPTGTKAQEATGATAAAAAE